MKSWKFKQLWSSVWQWLKDFDIKPAKPIASDLFAQALLAREADNLSAAIYYYKKITFNNHRNYKALSSLSSLYITIGDFNNSYKFIRQGIKYYPNDHYFYEYLGYAYSMQGKFKASAKAYKQALRIQPDLVSAQHFLNSVQQNDTDIAPRNYIEDLFNGYADTFEDSLVNKLGYRAHLDLTAYMLKHVHEHANIDKVLDLGCGTGLLGQALKDRFRIDTLIGVDLSEKMLAKSKNRNIYTELHQLDLLEYFNTSEHVYDFIVSTDVLIYIGDLEKIVAASYKTLKLGGLFGFSLEVLDKGSFKLMPSGRYQHSLDYITTLSSRSGFGKIYSQPIDLRKEYGNIVPGYLVLLQK